MASRNTRESLPVRFEEEESEDQQESTQDSAGAHDMMKALESAQDLMHAAKKRKDQKRKALEAAHVKNAKNLRAKVDAYFVNRNMRITKLQKAQLDRLAELNKKRRAIEGLILSTMKTIEHLHINVANELEAILRGREKDILAGVEA